MASGTLHIDLDAIAANWRALDALSGSNVETAAVLKADAYGLGAAPVAKKLAQVGARRFFVALAEEGFNLRQALGPGPQICVFGGHMADDTDMIRSADLVPCLNSVEQVTRHLNALPGHGFAVQLDSGMNRLGLEESDWRTVAPAVLAAGPQFLMSHLACADEPGNPQNATQLATFRRMTDGTGIARSLAATGGLLLGPDYHFDMTRPGIGVYGGAPFAAARAVVHLSLPVIQIRDVATGESVGYGATWVAKTDARIATLGAGYADGLLRAMTGHARVWDGTTPCPLVGRVSMDLMAADVTHLAHAPERLDILGPQQGIDALAASAGTIGYEILTALGRRHARRYQGGAA